MLLQPTFGFYKCCPFHSRASRRNVALAARKQQQSKKRKPKQPIDARIEFDDDGDVGYLEPPMSSNGVLPLPQAPAPSDNVKREEDEPAYPVFLPKSSGSKQSNSGGAWSWGEEGGPGASGRNEPPLPEWNPKTGFMRPAMPPPTDAQGSGQDSGGPGLQQAAQQAPVEPLVSFTTPVPDASSQDLPSVTQSQVMNSCIGTTFWMTLVAFFLRSYAQANSPLVLGTDEQLLAEFLRLPPGLETWTNAGVLLAAAGIVTAARFSLKTVWPEFRLATERSNKQILTPLNWFDILLVSCLTGFSEELLFRGAIVPATFLDWRGVLIAGSIFGLLHNSGGRNLAFAAWATAVGCLYGGAFVLTKNIWVPVAAHSIANFISAASWKAKRE